MNIMSTDKNSSIKEYIQFHSDAVIGFCLLGAILIGAGSYFFMRPSKTDLHYTPSELESQIAGVYESFGVEDSIEVDFDREMQKPAKWKIETNILQDLSSPIDKKYKFSIFENEVDTIYGDAKSLLYILCPLEDKRLIENCYFKLGVHVDEPARDYDDPY